ncbi:ArsR family transcriptional regulator [Lentzea guizhouensis]|uniref:ArsR family transcriptional regulator n=1 Tax=Lentzea guizhouensis TaxID=1586287 RepID=A0A1B2HAK6_9PSEU|nr:ROK family transcriptional regulator [Lentzea guizhouensis]ANZ34743.1 ArsR family transcriptional regulator [Lentzea guizhouensis]
MTAKPSVELLRSISDEHVLRSLLAERKLTRAELAVLTGLSKPTVSDSVRRLTENGLVADTGERTPGGRGKGRVGSFYALAEDVGSALVVDIGAGGVVAELVNVYGDVVARELVEIESPADVPAALPVAAAAVADPALGGHVRLAVVSAADPVDRHTGRLVQLPDSPFLTGELDPVRVLRPFVRGPVVVDNDVNWAARAEQASGDYLYLYLGEGLGGALVNDGEVRRGFSGLAGELAHVHTIGPDGRAVPFIEVFGLLGLRKPRTTAIDVDRLLAADNHALAWIADAVIGVATTLISVLDPELIVLGGSWGGRLTPLFEAAALVMPRRVPFVAAKVADAPITGARTDAVDRLQTAVIAASRG